MKNQLAAIELRVLVSEFQQLEGARLEKVYDIQGATAAQSGKSLVFQLGKSEGRKAFLACLAPSAAFLALSKPATPETPGGFCSLLRHHLDNARLVKVSQPGSERILELVFSSKNTLKLVIELFSKGNVILCDESGVIIGVAESQKWSDRTIRPGFRYASPPQTPDLSSLSPEQFGKALLSSEKDSIVKALAAGIGLGGAYAEELCSVAAVEKGKSPQHLSQQDMDGLYSALQQLLSRKPNPVAVLDDNGSVSEVFPFPIAAMAAARVKPFPSFSEAVEAISTRLLESSALSSRESSFTRKIREMEIAIEQQKATIAGMGVAAAESAAAAEAIYLHYADVKQVLDDYNRLRKAFTPEQLKEYFKSNRKVVSIDEKTGVITLELPNQDQ